MPDSPARRILGTAMARKPDVPPCEAFDAYLAEHERDPKFIARQDRIARLNAKRPLHPYYGGPAIGVAIVVVGLVVAAVVRWIGWL